MHLERPLTGLDIIFTRRSIRSYAPQKIEESTIRSLLDAAVQAPTALIIVGVPSGTVPDAPPRREPDIRWWK